MLTPAQDAWINETVAATAKTCLAYKLPLNVGYWRAQLIAAVRRGLLD